MIRIRRYALDEGAGKLWREQADCAMRDIIERYRPGSVISLDEQLYQAARPYLLALTHHKCAYCESKISNTQSGDVEHYRPKGRVRDRDGKVVRALFEGTEREHPGYWWLAYAWANLLPSCADCNRRRAHGEKERSAGKADHFAVRGKRALLPTDDLDAEDALLLDPTREDFNPARHFDFLDDGKLLPKTEKARYTCSLLGLNEPREALVQERCRAFYEAKDKITTLASQARVMSEGDFLRVARQINDMWLGRTPHTAFARRALELELGAYAARGIQLTLPLPIGS